MNDATQTTEATTTTEAPLPNSTEARTPTGEIRDAQSPNTNQQDKSSEQTSTEPKTEEKTNEPKTEGGAPETYADFKAPEGYTLSKDVIEAATPIFKELGLSQEAAQKLVDFHAKNMIDAAKAPMEAYQTLRQEWRDTVLKDPDLSSGGKLKTEVTTAIGKAIDGVGDPALAKDFREIMDISGVGDNPAFVKMMYKWAQSVTEGSHVTGKGPSPHGQRAPDAKPQSAAAALYPNLP